MDTWVIIVIAVVLIVLFIAVAGRSMFGGTRGDNTAHRTGQEPENFSDGPPDAGPRR